MLWSPADAGCVEVEQVEGQSRGRSGIRRGDVAVSFGQVYSCFVAQPLPIYLEVRK